MATRDLTTLGTTGISAKASGQFFVLEKEFDVGAISALVADVVQLMDIPAGFCVLGGELEIKTAGSTSVTGKLGITGGTVDGFIGSTSLAAAAGTIIPFDGAYVAAISGKHFTAADTIDLLIAGATDALGVYTLRVFGIQYNLNIT